jgi:RNA polymerase sigma factor (sigma-70 family)
MAFLYHILNNLIIDEYRKHKTVSLDNLSEKGFEPTEGSTDSLFNFLDGKRAVLLIQNLPQKYKQMVNLRYVKELTIEEIAKITGQSKNTVAVQSHRGLAKLRQLYNRD